MTNADALALKQQLPRLNSLKGVKLCYALIKFGDKAAQIEKAVRGFTGQTEEDQAFETRRVALLEMHCAKDEEGNPVIVTVHGHQEFTGLQENEEFLTAFKELKDEFSDTIEAKEDKIKEQQEFLQMDVDFEVHKIDVSQLPEDITLEQMQILSPLLQEEDV